MKPLLIFLFCITSLLSDVEIKLSHTDVKHGTTFAVIFRSDTNMLQAPNVIFKDKTYQMFTINGNIRKYEAFIPVSYYNKLQKENIEVRYLKDDQVIKENLSITIIDGNYKQNEIIQVAKGKVTLSAKNKERTAVEYKTFIYVTDE